MASQFCEEVPKPAKETIQNGVDRWKFQEFQSCFSRKHVPSFRLDQET